MPIKHYLGTKLKFDDTMPPARRVDDSRSETSQSTMANFRNTTQNGISKTKKPTNTSTIPSNLSRISANTNIPHDTDPNLPRTNWTSFPTPVLHAYAFTHRLPIPAPYTHPHAELLYKSSEVALRSPSQVAARRKLHDLKAARRRDSTVGSSLLKGKETLKERERSSERLKQVGENSNSVTAVPAPTSSATSTQRQAPASLALAVRRHFNSAQVNEGDAIARFLYVVRHGGHGDGDIRLIGGDGDGKGRVIGSAGRAVDRGLGISGDGKQGGGGCDLGFRLRFRPGT
jgi:hypothetical protein